MFLATTALREFWDTSGKILFLGSWCLRHDRRREWEGLRYDIVPSPWDDRDRYYAAAEYVDAFSERLLGELAEHLNAIHDVSRSVRYWRIVIGPWLLEYLHVLYDRYVTLTEALRRHPNLTTTVLDPRSFVVPSDTAEFTRFALDDPYNLQVFSQLLQGMGYAFPSRALPHVRSADSRVPRPTGRGGRGAGRRLAGRLFDLAEDALRRAAARRWRVGLCDAHCSKAMLWRLAWRSGFRVLRLKAATGVSPTPDLRLDERRQRLGKLSARDEFERLVAESLPLNVPAIYVEGYERAREQSLRRQPRGLRAIVSATGWFENEALKLLAAESAERGTRLVAMQHGGGYGFSRVEPVEPHEARIADAFMVWGWAETATQPGPTKNLPSPRLSALFAGRRARPVARLPEAILLVSTADFRYLHWFEPNRIATQGTEYLAWQFRFLAALPERVRSMVRYRSYLFDYGSSFRERIGERFPTVGWDPPGPIEQTLGRSRIVVVDHYGTTFLEALVANAPTVSFWSRRLWDPRPSAVPDFDGLVRVGIFCETPEAAAARVAGIYDDPWAWWGGAPVQDVRRAFVDRHALSRDDWAERWVRALEDEAAR